MKTMPRTIQSFDSDWLFHLGDLPIMHAVKGGMTGGLTDCEQIAEGEWLKIAYFDERGQAALDEREWKKVNLPHDWCVEGNYVNDGDMVKHHKSHGYLPVGIGCYRKVFEIPAEDLGKKILIEFDGIMRNSTVWVNGHLMGTHQSGYTGFCFDITDIARYGEEGQNVIFIKVDASDYEGWWYEGCGIYRHVWLVTTDRLHVGRHGTYVTTPVVNEDEAQINIRATLLNENAHSMSGIIKTIIMDSTKEVVASFSNKINIEGDSHTEVETVLALMAPNLWSPEQPYLYEVITEIYDADENQMLDIYKTPLGVRTLQFTADKGFFLNGKPYLIKGTCNHQDFAGVGVALPDQVTEYKIQLLKEMGCNAYRCAHHAPSPELLDLCDRLGMLVMDENRKLDISPDGIANLKEMLYRDRNHPSVIMWSMENEEILEGTIMGSRMLDTLSRITHGIDPTRPTISCMNHGWNDGGYSNSVDITGYNYGQRDDQYIHDHEQFPDRIMIGSESTSCTTTRGIYENDTVMGYCSSYGDQIPEWSCSHEKSWQDIVNHSHLTGIFVWTGFDYRGEPTPHQWPSIGSHFGIMDSCGFPKDAYFYYKAAWTDEPMVHVMPHWNWPDKIGQEIDVWTYSNCETMELVLNGHSLGEKVVDRNSRLEWKINYVPGELVAIGKFAGREIVRKVMATAGNPSKITMESDKITLNANDTDVAMIKVSILDHAGVIVPTADNEILFTIEGPGKILGVGNGNPSSHEPDKATRRRAFNGHCLAIIQVTKGQGEIMLRASSTSLEFAAIVIEAI